MKKKGIVGSLLVLGLALAGYFVWSSGQTTSDFLSVEQHLSLAEQKKEFLDRHRSLLSQEDLAAIEVLLERSIADLQQAGWSDRAIATGYLGQLTQEKDPISLSKQVEVTYQASQIFGSEVFQELWTVQTEKVSVKEARKLLEHSLSLIGMPDELSGSPEETRALLQRFDKELAPDDYFWGSFARLVQKAFPKDSLSKADSLAHKVHQFRYLISAQQAQWVREHYRRDGQTDREALVAYLAGQSKKEVEKDTFGLEEFDYFVDYDLEESSRLHNKAASLRGQSGSVVMLYPDFEPLVNIKIVLSFHTEFILSSTGRFANELDPEGLDENGVVNGASFNYANKNDALHRTLDIKPVKNHDPSYRKEWTKTDFFAYQAPNNLSFSFQPSKKESWGSSYFNKEGIYSINGKSSSERIREEIEKLKTAIKEAADD